MLKKTIKYVDYNDNAREETFHFNMNKAELIRFEMNLPGGIEKTVKKALAEDDNATLFNLFEQLIQKSYGKKTVDGGFAKSAEAATEFSQTEAYSELLMEFMTDPTGKKFADFFRGIMPKDYANELPEDLTSVIDKND